MLASDLLGAGRRMTLLDAQRQHVIGFPQILAPSAQREIIVAGRTVGWLAIAPVETVTDAAALHFLDDQLRTNLAVCMLAVLLAGLIAWWVARTLLAPVRVVAQATHQLACGAHDTRVPVQGSGEVAWLAQDFNQLALSCRKTDTDLLALIEQECGLARDACLARQQTLLTDLPSSPLRLQADAARLHDDHGEAVIVICDSAPGVPDVMLPRLFARFSVSRAPQPTSAAGAGGASERLATT